MKRFGRIPALALTVAATLLALFQELHELNESQEEQRTY